MILNDSEEQNGQNEQETQTDKKGEKQRSNDEENTVQDMNASLWVSKMLSRAYENEESDRMCGNRCQRHTFEVLDFEKGEVMHRFSLYEHQIIVAEEFMKMRRNEIANCENCANAK